MKNRDMLNDDRKWDDTPRRTNMFPLKRDYFNRKYIFQPSFFRGYVSFQEGNLNRKHEVGGLLFG